MSPGESTASPSIAVITSPALTPAFAAGPSSVTDSYQHALAVGDTEIVSELFCELHRAHTDSAAVSEHERQVAVVVMKIVP